MSRGPQAYAHGLTQGPLAAGSTGQRFAGPISPLLAGPTSPLLAGFAFGAKMSGHRGKSLFYAPKAKRSGALGLGLSFGFELRWIGCFEF